ncbi:MAG TPA: ABC transporter permease [Candidatus Paceibacterota bacterium]|nr:ABC transporter permease [Candidatus Paceibacterota bacterium]
MLATIRVAWFLAVRQIRRASPWTTALIVFVMMLTFLNLVVVGGILVGLPQGSQLAYEREYSGEVLIRSLPTKEYIERSEDMIKTLRAFPEVVQISPRYLTGGKIEANYRTAVGPKQEPDALMIQIGGIDPVLEHEVTGIGELLFVGENLDPEEEGYVLLGKDLLEEYTVGAGIIGAVTLTNVGVGSKVRVEVNGSTKELIIRGVLSSKIGEMSTRAFMLDTELRRLSGRTDRNVGEIAVRLRPGANPMAVRDALKASGFADVARIQTARESQGTFLEDIEDTFEILSAAIGSIGLMVASITVFIVIFINAVTRRKYIGILKGIGISGSSIELSYVFQSIFYATFGAFFGLVIIYTLLVPYFAEHPIDFPFSDGVLAVPIDGTLIRLGLLVAVTVIAGYLPARMIVKGNTLDAILGR